MRIGRGDQPRTAAGSRGGRISIPGGDLATALRGLAKASGVLGILLALVVAFLSLNESIGRGPIGPDSPPDGDTGGTPIGLVQLDKTGRSDLTAAEREELDDFVDSAVGDLVDYWETAFPEVFGSPYQQLGDVFAYSPSGGAPLDCGGALRPEQLSSSAIYCSDGDYITWDSDFLFPNLYANFGRTAVGVVLAHEWGHAIQVRAGLGAAPIVRELQADCFAGSWIRRGLDGSGVFDLRESDVNGAVAGFLLLRDPPGTPISARQGHGSAFDRMNAFREGVESGESRCATYQDLGPRIVDLVLQSDGPNTANQSYDLVVREVLADLEKFWDGAFRELGLNEPPTATQFRTGSTCVDAGEDENLLYCRASGEVEWNSVVLREMHRVTGDFATGLLLARLYGEALVAEAGAFDPSGLVADCLAGVWAGDVAYTSARSLEFSAGDLDEGMAALLNDPDGADAAAFDRVAAFENGFFEGDRGTLDSVELCGG